MISFLIERIATEQPYTALLIHTGSYPLAPEAAAKARLTAAALRDSAKGGVLAFAVFLQHEYLANGKEEFSAHLQQWKPESGLGVWPDRPAPRLWKTLDMFRMARGEKVPLMYRVLRIAGDAAVAADVFNRMTGSGMAMGIVHGNSVDSLMKQYKDRYLPGITELTLRLFPFYVPLLDVKSVRDRRAAELTDWLRGARLYMRESPEDKGILVITDMHIEPILAKAGAKHNDRTGWQFQ